MQRTEDLNAWKQHIEEILVQIETLKTWFDQEQGALSADMGTQLGQIEAEIQKLRAEALPSGNTQRASNMAMRIEALKARGDLAYDLLASASSRRGGQRASSA